jgi:hypothetical protein
VSSFVSKSFLLIATIVSFDSLYFSKNSIIFLSSLSRFELPSNSAITISELSIELIERSIPIFSIFSVASRIPAVSTNFTR